MNYRTPIILISHENKGRRVHTPNKYLLTYQKKEKRKLLAQTSTKQKLQKNFFNKLRKGFDQTRLSIFTVDLSLPTD